MFEPFEERLPKGLTASAISAVRSLELSMIKISTGMSTLPSPSRHQAMKSAIMRIKPQLDELATTLPLGYGIDVGGAQESSRKAQASIAAVLNELAAVFILLLAALFLRERAGPRQWAGTLLALAGVGLVVAA